MKKYHVNLYWSSGTIHTIYIAAESIADAKQKAEEQIKKMPKSSNGNKVTGFDVVKEVK